MSNYFGGLTEELKNKIHPEIYHFRVGNHPGPEWFLKTVCPIPNLIQIDKYGYGTLWHELTQEYPTKIKIVPYAYDWNGNEIPYMVSVWVNKKIDILISLSDNGFNISMVERQIGNEHYFYMTMSLIYNEREQSKWVDDIDLDDLDKIENIARILKDNIKSKDETHIKFRIINGGAR